MELVLGFLQENKVQIPLDEAFGEPWVIFMGTNLDWGSPSTIRFSNYPRSVWRDKTDRRVYYVIGKDSPVPLSEERNREVLFHYDSRTGKVEAFLWKVRLLTSNLEEVPGG